MRGAATPSGSDPSTGSHRGVDSGLASEHLAGILDVSRALMRQHNLADLLQLIAEETSRVMNAERSSIYIVDDERRELHTFVAQELEIHEIRVPMGHGISGYVAQTGETLNITDAYKDTRFDRSWDERTGFRTRTVLCMPLHAQSGAIVGVLQVLNKRNGRFSGYDERLLSAFVAQAAVAVENTRLYEENSKQFGSFIEALAAAIDAKSPFTAGHSARVAFYASRLARAVGLSPELVEQVRLAGLVHDIGKLSIPDEILNKPGRLTDEEYDIIREHPVQTREILSKIRFTHGLRGIPAVAASHHERLDGTGYPEGLKAENLPLLSRILAIADVYDATASIDRPYQEAGSHAEGLAVLERDKGVRFDPRLVDIFIEAKCYELPANP